jgi:biotin carboxyl carrier protein
MKFWVTLEGRDAEVAFQADGDRLWLELEGRRLEADFRRLPDGEVYSLLIDGHSHEVRVAPGRGALDVTVHGASLPVEVRHPIEKRLQSMDRSVGAARAETLQAPMPGLVVAVHVTAGDAVTAGQPLVVVEAMKMQNELVARHDGIVADVLARAGDSVGAGQPLLRLRPPS